MKKKGGHKICQRLALLGPPYSEDVHFNVGVEGGFSILILKFIFYRRFQSIKGITAVGVAASMTHHGLEGRLSHAHHVLVWY